MDKPLAEKRCIGAIFTELSQFVFEEVAGKNEPVEEISLSVQTMDKLLETCIDEKYTSYCIDLNALTATPEEIIHFLVELSDAKNVPIVLFARGLSMETPFAEELRRYGFTFWITASTLREMYEEFNEVLQGVNTAVLIAQKEQAAQQHIQDTVAPEHRSISFCGTVAGSGTSTQAIQYARYLQNEGVNVCYIEANGNKHMQKVATIEKIPKADNELGYLQYNGLDMYYKPLKISPSIRMAYDVCVIDYGVLCAENMPSFLTGLAKVCVANFSPWNIGRLRWASDVLTKEKVHFLFPFSQRTEKGDIQKILVNHKHSAQFPCFNNTLKEPIVKQNTEVYTLFNGNLLLSIETKKRRKKHVK